MSTHITNKEGETGGRCTINEGIFMKTGQYHTITITVNVQEVHKYFIVSSCCVPVGDKIKAVYWESRKLCQLHSSSHARWFTPCMV